MANYSENDVKEFLKNPVWLEIVDILDEVESNAQQAVSNLDPLNSPAELLKAQGQLLILGRLKRLPEAMLEDLQLEGKELIEDEQEG